MTRLAFGTKCSGLTTPRESDVAAPPAPKQDRSSSDARANDPSPSPVLERKARRAWLGKTAGLIMNPVCEVPLPMSIKKQIQCELVPCKRKTLSSPLSQEVRRFPTARFPLL